MADDDPDDVDDLEASPFQRWDQIPPAMRGVLLNIRWDRDALFQLSLPVEEIPVGDLRWQLELPWWRDGDRHFAVTPTDVRADPVRYRAHWERTLAADLRYPIHLLATAPRLRILDGVHRLLKAELTGQHVIRACRVDRESLTTIVIPKRRD